MERTSLRDWFEHTASRFGGKKAIAFYRKGKKETELDYARLNADAHGLALFLSQMGVHKGDRVVLFVPKCLFFVTAYLALQKLGAISVPLNPGFKKNEMDYLLDDVKAALVMTDPEKEAFIREIQPHVPILALPCHEPYDVKDLHLPEDRTFAKIELAPEDPAPISIMAMTAATPMTMPRVVSMARRGLRSNALRAVRKVR
ncbi:MAG: AMP-binding protein [Desulfobacterales bacterium]